MHTPKLPRGALLLLPLAAVAVAAPVRAEDLPPAPYFDKQMALAKVPPAEVTAIKRHVGRVLLRLEADTSFAPFANQFTQKLQIIDPGAREKAFRSGATEENIKNLCKTLTAFYGGKAFIKAVYQLNFKPVWAYFMCRPYEAPPLATFTEWKQLAETQKARQADFQAKAKKKLGAKRAAEIRTKFNAFIDNLKEDSSPFTSAVTALAAQRKELTQSAPDIPGLATSIFVFQLLQGPTEPNLLALCQYYTAGQDDGGEKFATSLGIELALARDICSVFDVH